MTYQDINDLIDRVEDGDPEAIAEARALSAKLSKRANVRLSALEKKGYTSGSAYKSAKYFLGEDLNRSKFSESKKLSGEDLTRNLELVNEFLNNPTSRIGYESNRRAGLLNYDDLLPDGWTKNRTFRKFLESDAWEEYKKTIYIHESKKDKTAAESAKARQVIRGITGAIQKGASVKELEQLYEDYKNRTEGGAKDIYSVFEQWESL